MKGYNFNSLELHATVFIKIDNGSRMVLHRDAKKISCMVQIKRGLHWFDKEDPMFVSYNVSIPWYRAIWMKVLWRWYQNE